MVTRLTEPQLNKWLYRAFPFALLAKPYLSVGKVYHVDPSLGVTGTILYDVHSRRTNTTLVASPTWARGQMGYQIELDGASQYYQTGVERIGSTGLFADSSETFSCSTWFYQPTGGVDGTVMSRAGAGGATRTFQLFISGLGYEMRIRGELSGFVNSHTRDAWHNFVVTWDAATVRSYFDGNFDSTHANTVLAAEESQNINFGSRTSGGFLLDGNLGGCRIWDRALNPNEIFELFIDPWADLRLRRAIYKAPVAVTVDMWHPEIQKPYIETPEIVAY